MLSDWKRNFEEKLNQLKYHEREHVENFQSYLKKDGHDVRIRQIAAYLGWHKEELGLRRVSSGVWEKDTHKT